MESKTMTVVRFSYEEDAIAFVPVIRSRLEEYAFQSPPCSDLKEEKEGWVSAHNFLDTDFSEIEFNYDSYIVFAHRVDKRKLNAATFRAHLAKKCDAWKKENGLERCPLIVKKEIKEEMEFDWLKRTIPSTTSTEVVWNLVQKYVVIYSVNQTTIDRITKRFYRTFGVKLVMENPVNCLSKEQVNTLLNSRNHLELGGNNE
jgi:DNA recombination-dependent growth factor C